MSAASNRWRLVPESGQLLHLDALRFVAACAIVITHSQGSLGFSSDGFGIFVDLFFAISGFVIAYFYARKMNGWADYRSFLWRRVARLGPLHWATLAAFVAIGIGAKAAGVHINNEEAFDLSCLPANAAFLQATALCPHYSFNGPSWSIGAEAIMYLMAPLAFVLMRKPVSAIITLAVVWAFLTAVSGDDWLGWTFDWGAARALPSFVLGVLLFYHRDRLKGLPCANAVYFGALIALTYGAAVGLPHLWLLGLAYITVIAGISADLSGRANPISTRLAPLGQLTYSVYMVHMLVLIVGQYIATSVLKLDGPAHTVFMAGVVAAVFPVGYLSLKTLEEPARDWFNEPRQRLRRQPPSPSVRQSV